MPPLTAEHPALSLFMGALRATSGPAAPEDVVRILEHALDATGYVLVKRMELEAAVSLIDRAASELELAQQR